MLRTGFFCGALLICAAVPVSVKAQSMPYVDVATSTVVNPKPYPVSVLLVHYNADKTPGAHQVLRVEARTSAPVTIEVPASLAFVPLNPKVVKAAGPTCPNGKPPVMQLTPVLVAEQLNRYGASVDSMNKVQQKADLEKGQIQFDQYMDEVTVARNDPLQAELKSEQQRNMTAQQSALAQQQSNFDQTTQMMQDTMMYAFSNTAAIDDYNANASAESSQIQGMIDGKREYIAKLHTNMTQHMVLVNAEREFNASAAAELKKTELISFEFPKGARVERVCGGPAFDDDYIGMKTEAPADVTLLLGHVHFDKGGDEEVILSRIGRTPQFWGKVYWPLDATHGSVSVAGSKGLKKLGEIAPGRPSVQQQVAKQEKAIGSLKRAKRTADFAACGGDETKTAIIP